MADIGATLREARMRARIDISEVEAQTKIRAKYLRAIENEEWDLLPGSVFVKSFLKTYGDYLGLDTRLLIDEYKRRYERPSDGEPRTSAAPVSGRDRDRGGRDRRPRGGRPSFLTSPMFVGLVVIIAIVAALALIGLNSNQSTPPVTGQTQTDAGSRHHHHRSGTHKHGGQSTSTSSVQTTPPTAATLQIVPTGAIYVCVQRPNGTTLVASTFAAGQTVPKLKGKQLLATFGTTNADVKVNGKPYQLTSNGSPVALKITVAGAAAIPVGPTCT